MAKVQQTLFSNARFRQLAEGFFTAAERGRCKTPAEWTEGVKSNRGFKLIRDQAFVGSTELWESLHHLRVNTVELVGPSVCHEDDVEAAAWDALAASTGPMPGRIKLLAQLIVEPTETTTTFITSNFAVRLLSPVRTIAIGPVRIRATSDVAEEIKNRDERLVLAIGEGKSAMKDGKFTIFLTPVCWETDVKVSPGRVAEEARALVNAALTLLRLKIIKGPRGGMFPYHGEREADPFDKPLLERKHVTTTAKGFTSGGMALPRQYEVNSEIADRLSDVHFVKLAKSIFEPKKNSVGERTMRGLNWMSRARQSVDLAERFLFCFTAVEALLSSESKTAPVIETVARRAATMISPEADARFRIAKMIRSLYEKRSDLVHRGIRGVSHANVSTLESLVDILYQAVLEKADVGAPFSEFQAALDKAGYGFPWPPLSKS